MQFAKPRSPEDLLHDNVIVKHISGSHAYGTNIEGSDLDIRGVFIADPINILTPWFTIKEGKILDSEDAKLHEFHAWIKLVVEQSPNIVETLWVDWADVTYGGDAFAYLRDHRHLLLSKRVAFKFTGFAHSQLNRIRGHNKWINKPQPEERPQQVDFVSLVQWFGETKVLPSNFSLRKFANDPDWRLVPYGGNIFGLYGYVRSLEAGFSTLNHHPYKQETGELNTVFEGERHLLPAPAAIVKYNASEYKQAVEKWKQYWDWKRDRNPERAKLEEKSGYDTKHGVHVVRLMRMAKEILTEGVVRVRRPDAEELRAIRSGSWSYEEIVEWAEEMDEEIRGPLYQNSDLPREVNLRTAAKIVGEVQDIMWRKDV